VDRVRPVVDQGHRPAKAAVGQRLNVEADAFVDGHDLVACELRFRHAAGTKWTVIPMHELSDDRWGAQWLVESTGWYRFAVRAAVDPFATWRRDLQARLGALQDVTVELAVGAALLNDSASRAKRQPGHELRQVANLLVEGARGLETPIADLNPAWQGTSLGQLLFSTEFGNLVASLIDPATMTSSPTYQVFADIPLARCSAWYELFPRSAATNPKRHGTFSDMRRRLGEIERMGFDILYLPPIHPIGRTGRKGPDGTPHGAESDPGSPWAIGAAEGGHVAIHPELGSVHDFDQLVTEAAEHHMAIAIDLAFQASPDHPWVKEHPSWFKHRPDGTIRYAENPPKKYEDIYPLDFESEDWQSLWEELLDVVFFWIDHGVRVFRVDNPHTKPFAFWEWLIGSVRQRFPEVIFLAEAFTRPQVMKELAKRGFTQSYTYFTWRTSKWDLETYMRELTESDMADYFRPNFWPNTPDILSEELQHGGRAAFVSRLILAATLSPNYGIYGPAFELQEHVPRSAGSEEYRRSEKYELRSWDLAKPDSLADLVTIVNQIRRAHPALQHMEGLHFHRAENDRVIAYSRRWVPPTRGASGDDDRIVVIVNLDHAHEQSAFVDLDLGALGLDPTGPYVMHDLLTGAKYQWQGWRNFVILNPEQSAHVFAVSQFQDGQVSG
jgi:starch synthase (maltosyl-transferring)